MSTCVEGDQGKPWELERRIEEGGRVGVERMLAYYIDMEMEESPGE